jgi:hypothetical protein
MPGVHTALHRTAIPLRSIAAGELQRYDLYPLSSCQKDQNSAFHYETQVVFRRVRGNSNPGDGPGVAIDLGSLEG